VADYGAELDGTTDDSEAIIAAIAAASANSGGDVFIPSGDAAAITASLTLKNDVRLVLGTGAVLKWTGASGGTMITSGGTDPLLRSGVIGGTLDPNALADYCIDVRSPQFCAFGGFDTDAGHATTVVLRMRTDVTNFSGYDGTKNAVHNRTHDIVADTCGTVLSLTGTDATAICTLNEYRNIHGGDVRVAGIRIVQWTDNNKFTGIHRYEINADDAIGVIMQDTGTPAVDAGVYSNNFDYLAIDAFGSFSGRIGVQLNSSKYTVIRDFTAAPEPEGGALDVTNSTSHVITRGGTDGDASIVVSTRDVEHPDGFAVDSTHKLYNDANGPIWLVDGNGYMAFNRANDLFEFVAAGGFALKIDALGSRDASRLALTDGVSAPSVLTGNAQIYVDSADGDLKCIFSDGTIKTIVVDS
jgi:hypothetical protein